MILKPFVSIGALVNNKYTLTLFIMNIFFLPDWQIFLIERTSPLKESLARDGCVCIIFDRNRGEKNHKTSQKEGRFLQCDENLS